jgi:hypothetical protein
MIGERGITHEDCCSAPSLYAEESRRSVAQQSRLSCHIPHAGESRGVHVRGQDWIARQLDDNSAHLDW